MKSLIAAVTHFMHNHGIYDNDHDVEIVISADDSLMIAANWPGESNNNGFNIEIYLECRTIADLIRLFELKAVKDLLNITPVFLINLFDQGKADICCAIDSYPNYYPMQFRKTIHGMTATNDQELEHFVTVLLETPEQFREYTQQCYLTVNC